MDPETPVSRCTVVSLLTRMCSRGRGLQSSTEGRLRANWPRRKTLEPHNGRTIQIDSCVCFSSSTFHLPPPPHSHRTSLCDTLTLGVQFYHERRRVVFVCGLYFLRRPRHTHALSVPHAKVPSAAASYVNCHANLLHKANEVCSVLTAAFNLRLPEEDSHGRRSNAPCLSSLSPS